MCTMASIALTAAMSPPATAINPTGRLSGLVQGRQAGPLTNGLLTKLAHA